MSSNNEGVGEVIQRFWQTYQKTEAKLKLIDLFLVYILLTGVAQFAYVCVTRVTFPFNSFLAGFIASIGCFVLTVALRMQVNPANRSQFNISPERAFADFLVSSVILLLVVVNFIG
mmetsp:Transcript_1817/g.4136  ORF Transcript_1817/g.4136 Transcript_1817/m.4136 type:complete len:116 (-) Transcript_1817:60-407(-)|eukprot:CAMPEP_0177653664 /NCGR_PEP_ID=MMETSP0447-20121125/13870_1 /TAXON_ID=0 /ORGANISM="Stygamoeba regulata, Strain BSH-02190019" /LENGTH=115 /DNA_ID=CAMNT_0019157163 /DNA_START=106 /DNA_END=453 /DNA_ORIENTATION=-